MSNTLTNLPKLSDALAPVRQMIDAETEPLKVRRDELIASVNRFIAAHPVIDNDEIEALATEVLAVCQRFITPKTGLVDRTREAFKKPLIEAGNLIGSATNGPFAAIAYKIEIGMQPIKKATIDYKNAKIARIKEEQDRARQLADQAALAERMAERRGTGMDEAARLAAEAEAAQKAASVSIADRTRSHGDRAGVSSLRFRREYRIVNPAIVPREYCSPDPVKINAAKGKPQTPFPVIPGVEFSDEPDLTVGR